TARLAPPAAPSPAPPLPGAPAITTPLRPAPMSSTSSISSMTRSPQDDARPRHARTGAGSRSARRSTPPTLPASGASRAGHGPPAAQSADPEPRPRAPTRGRRSNGADRAGASLAVVSRSDAGLGHLGIARRPGDRTRAGDPGRNDHRNDRQQDDDGHHGVHFR